MWGHRTTGILSEYRDRFVKDGNDKNRKYRSDYNNNPTNTVEFMSAIGGTNGRLHSDFIRLLFLQSHRETDRFFVVSGVQSG